MIQSLKAGSKQQLTELFLRLEGASMASCDWIAINEIDAQVDPRHVDYWFENKLVMEPDILPFRHLDDEASVILDVGSHTGYTAVSLRNLPLQNYICSIEPMALYSPALSRIKELDARYDFSPVAASDASGQVKAYNLSINGVLFGGTTSIGGVTFKGWFVDYVMTRLDELFPDVKTFRFQILDCSFDAVRLDDLMISGHWHHRPIAGLKIDVEGHEASAIRGAEQLLKQHRPLVMIEAGYQAAIIQQMGALGYRPYDRVDDRLRPRSGSHYNIYFVHDDSVPLFKARGVMAG